MKPSSKAMIKANYQQVLFVFLAFATMVLVSYYYVGSIVRRQMLAIGEEMMNTTEAAVAATLTETELAFANVFHTVEDMLIAGYSQEEIEAYLTSSTTYFRSERSPLPDFMKLYGYIRGEFLDGSDWIPPADYDPPSRPWYIGAMENGGGIFFSEPYVDADTGGTVLSFSQQLLDGGGAVRGVLAIDLNLTRITEFVRSQQLRDNGYGVLLSDTLGVAAHRHDDLAGMSMYELSGEYARLAAMLEGGGTIAAERFTDLDGTDSVAFFRTILNGWHIGIIAPRFSYYSPVNGLAVTLGSLGFILMVALSYILVRTRAEKLRSDEESRSKSTFLARMSHEMRTPMNAIIGMTSIARGTEDPQRIRYCLDKISDAADHLLGVINDILDMSKIEAGKLELSPTDFLLQRMIQQITGVINFKLEEKHQTLRIRVEPEVPLSIVADRQRLAQVITNLLSNANKFTADGGEISLRIRRLEDTPGGLCTLEVSVRDNGIGIAPADQAKLFRAFEQADGSISRKFGGTGLGLAISHSIVELMQGTFSVESEPGVGSTFTFTIRAPAGAATHADDLSPDIDWKRLRVMAVDDAPEVLESFRDIAAVAGFTCATARDGAQAVEMLEADAAYSIVFVDWRMPGMDGVELTRRIRERYGDNPVVIMISATEWSYIEDDAKAAGVNRFLPKPLVPSSIIDCINECIAAGVPAGQRTATSGPPGFGGKRILLVEDVEINREILMALLEDTGVEIDCAENGREACERFEAAEGRYDLVFMDIHMPEVDGYEATRRIRAMGHIPGAAVVPIVAMTANVFREDVEKCLAAGMNGHVGKPLEMDEVFTVMKRYL